ncbi:SurA N-terminal domain-containing protein, partial [Candidatus Saccharibacteria bacterium]|nr:SurA N-terminal domain-containing protein [Candidatus Saccharibacteria bacterium]
MKKKSKNPEKTKLSSKVPRPFKRKKSTEDKFSEALKDVPRITNETVAEHREDVLSSARKFIYPLQHSKRHVVRNSILIFVAVVLGFFAYVTLSLYKFQSTSGFIYGVTRVVPFPVAKVGDSWVSYESYLFELRRNMHYYHTQQQTDFSTKSGKDQLALLKKQAMNQAVEDAYVKQLAEEHGVSVSAKEVDNQVELVRQENRLGNSERVFSDVLQQFWGWDQNDFKRELRQQLLQQAVVAKLDTQTNSKAQAAIKQLQGGADFAKLAKQVSQDPNTAPNGGAYAAPITATSRDVAPVVTASLFKLEPGQTSGIINTGYTLEIVKVLEKTDTSVTAAHIQFNFKPITDFTKPFR